MTIEKEGKKRREIRKRNKRRERKERKKESKRERKERKKERKRERKERKKGKREIRKRKEVRERKERKERKKEGYDRKWLKGNSDGRDQVEGREIFLSVFFRQIKSRIFSEIKNDLLSFAIALVISCCIEKLEVISIAK
jgi:hypothetical protein